VRLSLKLILFDGIQRQMNAFRGRKIDRCHPLELVVVHSTILDGFNRVFSLEHLQCFTPKELQLVLCGNQWPSWTLDDLLTYVEPNHGFTRDRFVEHALRLTLIAIVCQSFSSGYIKFLNVMLALDGVERKSVIQFITGCSSLPPGGTLFHLSRRDPCSHSIR
jgi:hypothetical protein